MRVGAHLWNYAHLFVGAAVSMVVATVFALAVPVLFQVFLDTIFGAGELPPFLWVRWLVARFGGVEALRARPLSFAVVMPAMAAVNGIGACCAARWIALAAERSAAALRTTLYDRLHRVSVAYHTAANSGDLIQRCTSDVDTVRRFFAVQIIEVGRALALVAVAVPIMVRLHPLLTVSAVAILPWSCWYTRYFFRRVEVVFRAGDEAEGRLTACIQEHLAGIRAVRSLGRIPHEVARFTTANEEHRRLATQMARLLAQYWTVAIALVMVQVGVVVVFGSILAIRGELTVGGLLVFIAAELMLLWPVREMGVVLADVGKARVAAGRINEVLAQPLEDADPNLCGAGDLRPTISGKVEFCDVAFSYGATHQLQGVSFVAHKGETVGILGATGAGKSTLVALLARFYDPSGGAIRVDGVDITRIDRLWLRRHLGVVLQEPFLYAKTVRENIALARGQATDDEVHDAARRAAIHGEIIDFEKGYQTVVGERGITLSGGQKQRVAIARALLTNAPIMIFDDSLSAVDAHTDAAICDALFDHRATVFMISHRVTTLARCDRVVVLAGGRVIEQGSPRQLLAANGEYARAWSVQLG